MKRVRIKRKALVRPSPVFIDMVCLTANLDHYDLELILKKVKTNTDNFYKSRRPSNYKYAYGIKLPDEKGVLVELQHKRKLKKSGFRCVFNPHSPNFPLIASLLDQILPLGYANLLDQCSFTRVDVTTDLPFKLPENLLIHVPRAQTNLVISGRDGLETLYIGRRRGSKRLLRVYDKCRQMRKPGGRTPFEIPQVDTTRLEFEVRRVGPLHDLKQLPNQFISVRMYDVSELNEESIENRLFIDSCRFRGCNNSMLMMTRAEKRRYARKIEHLSAPYWNPEKIWQGWDATVDRLLHPPITPLPPIPHSEPPGKLPSQARIQANTGVALSQLINSSTHSM